MNEGEEDVDQPNYTVRMKLVNADQIPSMTSHCGPLYFEYINMIQL
jgi:hypothetical protein